MARRGNPIWRASMWRCADGWLAGKPRTAGRRCGFDVGAVNSGLSPFLAPVLLQRHSCGRGLWEKLYEPGFAGRRGWDGRAMHGMRKIMRKRWAGMRSAA